MSFSRWGIARHSVQLLVIALLGSPLAGKSFFQGTLAAGDLFGLPLADPLAALQVLLASGVAVPGFVVSAAGVTLLYFLLGSRTFCGWICPVYLLTELGDRLRRRIGSGERTLPLATKQALLLLTLVATAATGLPYFETISPIGLVSRAVAFGSWLGLLALGGMLVIEIILARRVWCRSLCPLGGFYTLVGRYAPLRIGFIKEKCTACGACTKACPVEEVLEPCLVAGAAAVYAGDCTRCCDCIAVCQEKALRTSYSFSR